MTNLSLNHLSVVVDIIITRPKYQIMVSMLLSEETKECLTYMILGLVRLFSIFI